MSGPAGTADRETLAYYDAHAADYDAWSAEGGGRAELARFIALLPPRGRALDLGCGGGWAAAGMMAAGLEVRALDASEGLVAQARARGVPAEIGRFEALEEEGVRDGVWVSFSLLHAPRAAWPDALARIRRALRPGGTLFLGTKAGTGEMRDRLGRRYTLMEPEELRARLEGAGFADVEIERRADTGRDGEPAEVLLVFARAPAAAQAPDETGESR